MGGGVGGRFGGCCCGRLRTAGRRFPTVWTRRASPENTSRDTGRTGERASPVFVAGRRYGGRLWQDEAVFSVHVARARRAEGVPFEGDRQSFLRHESEHFRENRRGILRSPWRPQNDNARNGRPRWGVEVHLRKATGEICKP